MIIFYVFLLISYTVAEDIASASSESAAVTSENAETAGDSVVAGQTVEAEQSVAAGQSDVVELNDEEDTIPIAGSVNFAGHARASGKVTIIGSTEPTHFDNPWGLPTSVEGQLPDDYEDIIYIEYPGSLHPNFDHGLPPPYLLPHTGLSHNVPIPYGAPIFPPTPTMSHPHFIEILEPTISPSFMQPQLVEIYEPTMGPGFMDPHFIELIDPFGSQPILDPFHPGLDWNHGMHHPSYPYFPHDMEMVPVIVEFDTLDPMYGQMLDSPGSSHDVRRPTKRETEYVPVRGKVTIVGKF